MHTAKQIADINFNAMVSCSGCISPKEKEFVRSVHAQYQRPGFTGLSPKQESWLKSIEQRLNDERRISAARSWRGQRAYAGVCASW